ncbi:MAG: PAS domain S-box protein [Crocinitomicaceae bacterium]
MESKRFKILYVEDNEVDQMAFSRSIRYFDEFTCSIVDNISDAVTYLNENKIDLVVTDHNLGADTALDFIPKIKNVPVVFLTGSGNEKVAVEAMKLGAYDYILKMEDYSHLKVLPVVMKNTIKQYKAEQLLKQSEKRFRDLFQNSYDLIQSMDIDNKFNYTNPAWKNTLGYSDEEIKNLTIKDVIHPDWEHKCDKFIERLRAGENQENIDIIYKTKNGEDIHLNGNIQCDFIKGKLVSTHGIFRNNTKRRLAQLELEESEEKYRFIVENANDIIFKTDLVGNCTYVNEVAAAITGYTISDLLLMNYSDLVKDNWKDRVKSFYANQLSSRKLSSYFEYEIRKKNGEYKWMGQNARIVYDHSTKKITGMTLIARDITDIKSAEKELIEKNKLLLAQQEEINTFNVSLKLANEKLFEQNKNITDSINYAKRIQDKILVSKDELATYFQHYFIFYQPKDIVSGDFYWAHKLENDNIIWAVADCTGHGVPGAFMSMLSITLLNEIVIEKKNTEPDIILNLLREGIINAMTQNNQSDFMMDGLDVAICVLDNKNKTLEFSGAVNSLYLVYDKVSEMDSPRTWEKKDGNSIVSEQFNSVLENEKHKLLEIKGDRQPISYFPSMKPFTKKTLTFVSGDSVYLISDGFPDQIGGERHKKYKYKPLRQLFLDLQDNTITRQGHLVKNELNTWKQDLEQLDDILVMGIKIP